MRPHFCSRMPASAGCTEKNAPVRLTLSVLVQSSSETFSAGALSARAGIGDDDVEFAARRLRMLVELRDRCLSVTSAVSA